MTSEEVNKHGIRRLLDMIPSDLNGLERAVICNDGTVQTMLSAIFYAPIRVDVVNQHETDTEILRAVKLIAIHEKDHEFVVCRASSVIQKKGLTPGFLVGIREHNMGIGQLISSIGINTNRSIFSMDSSKKYFERQYEIKEIPDDTYDRDIMTITKIETFTRELYAINGV